MGSGVGNAELEEGSNAEAIQYAGRAGLNRLTTVVEDQRERFYRLMPELLREDPRRALVLAEIGAGYLASLVVVGVDRAAEAEYVPREIALDGADELVDLVAPAQLDVGIDVAGTGRVELLDQLATRPALVVDRSWDVVAANNGLGLLTTGVAERLLEPPVNALRLALAPDGMAPRIVNLGEWREHVLERLRRQIAATGDPSVQTLGANPRRRARRLSWCERRARYQRHSRTPAPSLRRR